MNKCLVLVDLQNDYFPGGKMQLAGIEDVAENEIQKRSITPDEYYDYLNSVAPKENVQQLQRRSP